MPGTKLIIFDLDGTVNDSSPGIMHCYRRTAESYGVTDVSEDAIRAGLCGPFFDNIMKILGLPAEKVPDAIHRYTEFYVKEGQSMARLFDGAAETIKELKNRGYKLGIATLMADLYAKGTLKNYGMLSLFDTVHGASLEVPLTKKDLLEMCLEDMGVEPEECVLVGDGIDDHLAAKELGIPFIGATYGYQVDREYCEKNDSRYVDRISDLLGMFQ